MITNREYYKQLCRLSKKTSNSNTRIQKNIKEAYRDLGSNNELSKKYLAKMVAY